MSEPCKNCDAGTVRGNGWNDHDHCCTDCGGSGRISYCEQCGDTMPGDEHVCEDCCNACDILEFQEILAANDARSLSDTMGRAITTLIASERMIRHGIIFGTPMEVCVSEYDLRMIDGIQFGDFKSAYVATMN